MSSSLLIPFESVEEHLQCSICLSVIRGAVLTPCGHRYCSKCIQEWAGRNQSCPCCNSRLSSAQFYYDVQFDALTEIILKERDKAEQEYFDKVFSPDDATTEVEAQGKQSPFEAILRKHLKNTLLSHEQYFKKLRSECQGKIHMLELGLNTESLTRHDGDLEELRQSLQSNLENSERLAAQAFDKYLTENMISLELLPVDISVCVPEKELRLDGVTIRPSDSLAVVKPTIEAALEARCDKLLQWREEGGLCLLFSPLSKRTTYSVQELKDTTYGSKDIQRVTWSTQPLLQHNMRPGSELVVHAAFSCQSDLPQVCFANSFQASQTQEVDYFWCKKCNVKWICKSCIQCCHNGHDVTPFVMKHTPTWACCYCPKKKLCTIQTAAAAMTEN